MCLFILILPVHVYRKERVKRQKIVHSYGEDLLEESNLEDELEHRVSTNAVPNHLPVMQDTMPNGVDFIVGGKYFKFRSSTHQCISHQDCPVRNSKNARQQSSLQDTPKFVQPDIGKHCKCGSSSHRRTSHHDCPLRKPQTTHS